MAGYAEVAAARIVISLGLGEASTKGVRDIVLDALVDAECRLRPDRGPARRWDDLRKMFVYPEDEDPVDGEVAS
jgi:hypothetical protein